MWEPYKNGFRAHLQLERSLSDATVQAYEADLEKFTQYLEIKEPTATPSSIKLDHLQGFIKWISELGMTATSQSRIVS